MTDIKEAVMAKDDRDKAGDEPTQESAQESIGTEQSTEVAAVAAPSGPTSHRSWVIAAAVLGGVLLLLVGFLGGAMVSRLGPGAVGRHLQLMSPAGFGAMHGMKGDWGRAEMRGGDSYRGGGMRGQYERGEYGQGGGRADCDGQGRHMMDEGLSEGRHGMRGGMQGQMPDGMDEGMMDRMMDGKGKGANGMQLHEQMHRQMHEKMERQGQKGSTDDAAAIR